MQGNYTTWLVCLSVAVAIFVSYTALHLASRVSVSAVSGRSSVGWLLGGAFSMGLGMWSMHFIGMLALQLPIQLTYSIPITLGSLGVAIVTSGFALAMVSGPSLSLKRLCISALVMGSGIASMHYMGMWGIRIVPGVSYDPVKLVASITLAIAASFVALWLAFRLRHGRNWQMVLARLGAALVMGGAISGMHYTGMAAARFVAGSYCLPGARLENEWFGIVLGIFTIAVTAVTLIAVIYDSDLLRHLRARDHAITAAAARARRATMLDPLTGLPNRQALTTAVDRALQISNTKTQLAVMVINVDRLKAVNDARGHQAGDELLLELSSRMRRVLRRKDTLARLAGDEFTILAVELDDARDAEVIAGKVLDAVRAPFLLDNTEVHVSVSIGISMHPLDGATCSTLLRRAGAAMRVAKQTANSYRFYSEEMASAIDDRLALEADVRRALETNELKLHYQPKVDIATGRIRSAEALLRWHHPVRGDVPPDMFIPVAEDTGLIVRIGSWVLHEACRQMRAWLDSGMSPIRVAVNISARQFSHGELLQTVRNALEESRLDLGCLEIELTESAIMHTPEQSARTMQELSRMGVHISIDDFGTGYSSLSYLRRFPLDKLKIDRGFVRDVLTNADDAAIVRAIISLAHSLRLRVVAEGVETQEQLAFLRELGCDQYQGYLCSRALPADEFAALLRDSRASKSEVAEADMLHTHSRLTAFTPELVR